MGDLMSESGTMFDEDSIRWKIIRVGNLIFEQHERNGQLVAHKLFGDPTITLIQGEKNILVDPGYGPYRELKSDVSEQSQQEQLLLSFLKLAGVELDNINIVFITHRHQDHSNLVSMFERAGSKIKYGGTDKEQVIEGVYVLHTPGHGPEHGCLLFNSPEIRSDGEWSDRGPSVVIAGDAIVNLDYFKELAPYWMNRYTREEVEQTRETMRKISEKADIIVPGHGQPFLNLPELHTRWPPDLRA